MDFPHSSGHESDTKRRRKTEPEWDLFLESDSEVESSEFEDIPLTFSYSDNDAIARKKNRELQAIRNRKISTQYLGIICYTLHASFRNRLVSDKLVKKTLKKLLPESLTTKAKHLKNSIKKGRDGLDAKFFYILQYLVKWFRLNYKITSNGLRVLGFAPQDKNPKDYFPSKDAKFSNKSEFLSLLRKFEGSRDLGAQLFTGLVRALGFEARLVFSLPVLGLNSKTQPKFAPVQNIDFDLLYPYFWTEVINPLHPSEIIVVETCCFGEESHRLTRLNRFSSDVEEAFTPIFYPVRDQFNQMQMHYVISLNERNLILDVSSRYMKNVSYRWFNKLDFRTRIGRACLLFQTVLRSLNQSISYSSFDNQELDGLRALAMANYDIPKTMSAMKASPNFTTESTLRYNEIIVDTATSVTEISLNGQKHQVFFKSDIVVGKSTQQWKFVGRSVKPEQEDHPVKTVKHSPRTISNRRRFNLNISNNAPELNKVPLYSFSQTCPYIKMKVTEDGKLPRNSYGNVEIFRKNMVPDDCEWIQLSQIDSILSSQSKLHSEIPFVPYVPVVAGFRFDVSGHAIPTKSGVIVHSSRSIDAKRIWISGKIQQERRESRQRRLAAFKLWDEFMKRLSIKKRLSKYDDHL